MTPGAVIRHSRIHRLGESHGETPGRPPATRALLPGLDQGRADVILAGALVVREILNFSYSSEMMVSLTDLSEGALLDMLGMSLES